MKTKFRFILAAFAALFLVSCAGGPGLAVQTPFGTALLGGAAMEGQDYGHNGPPQQYADNGHGGPPGARRSYSRDREYAQEDREVFEGRGGRKLVEGKGQMAALRCRTVKPILNTNLMLSWMLETMLYLLISARI